MAYRVLTADRVKPGDALPELSFDVRATDIVLGAMASRDWRPQHHDHHFATKNAGVRDIFMNTPNLAAWFERFVTDWTGPYGRMGWIRFRMKDSVFPGETMLFRGTVKSVDRDASGCAWAELELVANGRSTTVCTARVAIPAAEGDNPWKRRGEEWRPRAPA
jgi:acyl dehydratase